MSKSKIFISHSSRDLEYVISFIENVLILGLDVDPSRIFCSSMEGQGIKSGQYIPDRLRDEINSASLALLFISKNYKASEICLNELGATWVSLPKESVIPLLLPNIDFSELGLLDLNRLGIKVFEREGVLKLIQDCKEQLNPRFNLEKIHKKIEKYLEVVEIISNQNEPHLKNDEDEELNEYRDCFVKNLEPLDLIIRKSIPAHADGIHNISDKKTQNKILTELSSADFLKTFWYKKGQGDYYVEHLKELPSGNWLISHFNWEIKISDMWVCMDAELQYEFILIHSEKQEPYKIDSDIGGESYNVGVLSDGTIVSENERINGYAIIHDKTIDIFKLGVEPRIRSRKSEWVFFVSYYHKAGFNADETIQFCKKLDSGIVEVNEENIMDFLRTLRNHPIINMYR